MARSPKDPAEILCRVPVRAREWEHGEEGRVTILEPRYGTSAPGRWLARLTGRPFIPIRLDAVGSTVWRACDGERTVEDLAADLRQAFGKKVEPALERLVRFLLVLERNRLLRWARAGESCCSPSA